jgi:hypothetical protein
MVDQLARNRAWPALLLVPGAVLVHVGHIFAPTGVAGMLLLGVGTAGTAWSARRATFPAPTAS